MGYSQQERAAISRQFHRRTFWTRFGMIFLGVWMLTGPETFGYEMSPIRYSDWISGLMLIFFGFLSMSYRFRAWVWGGCFVGIWLQLAPLLFWIHEPAGYLNDTLIGVIAIGLCVLVPLRPNEFDKGPQIPKGWSYNPSSWQQRVPIIFFGIVGWFVARYLCAFQLGYISEVWPYGGGTVKVITSMIAKNFPVPDAGLGALAYSLEAIMGAKGGVRRWHTMPWLVLSFGILVVPLGFVSIVLVTLQPVVVGAWCVLCLIIAACMLVMLALAVDEVVCVCQYIKQEMQQGRKFFHVLFKGSNYDKDELDSRTPAINSGFWLFLKSMTWGVRVPWNLLVTALIGVFLLFSSHMLGYKDIVQKNTDVIGALLVVFSVISWAEVARALRFINMVLMLWMVVVSFILDGASASTMIWGSIIAVVVVCLSFFKGAKIYEKYGSWQKLIF